MSTRRSFLAGLGAAGGVLSLPGLARAIQDTSSPYRRPKLKITDVRTAQVMAHGPQVHVRVAQVDSESDRALRPHLIVHSRALPAY